MMQKKINVLFLASYYPDQSTHTGPFIKRHAEAIQVYNNVFVLAAYPSSGIKNKRFEIHYEQYPIPTVRVYYRINRVKVPVIKNVINFYNFFFGLKFGYNFLIKTHTIKFDLAHVNVIKPIGIFALFLLFFKHLPYLITEHSSSFIYESYKKTSLLANWFNLIIIRYSQKMTVVSKMLGDEMIKDGLIKDYEVIGNVINTSVFYPVIRVQQKEKKEIIHVSNLKQIKGVENIIRAVQLLYAERNDFRLRIIGDGDNRERYETLSQELNLANDVIFFEGQKNEQEIAKYMQNSTFILLNSDRETFCVVMLEAMACGIPIVAPDKSAINENLNKDRGILMKDSSVKTLVLSIHTMLDTYQNYQPSKLSEYVENRFTPKIIGKKYHNLYLHVIAKTSSLLH